MLGIVNVKDTLQALRAGAQRSIADLMREAYFVPETKKVSELLREFQRRHLWMAIVVDEYGGVSGLVTVEDLLEEIVGEISDEHEDEREPVSRIADGVFSVSGKANIAIVRDLFGRGPEEEEFTTVGRFLASRLGHIPRPGETYSSRTSASRWRRPTAAACTASRSSRVASFRVPRVSARRAGGLRRRG